LILHIGFELPEQESKCLNHEVKQLTSEEERIIKTQIRRNSKNIQFLVEKLDLFLNRERVPQAARHITSLRERLTVLIEENDTFRKVLWKHFQAEEACSTK